MRRILGRVIVARYSRREDFIRLHRPLRGHARSRRYFIFPQAYRTPCAGSGRAREGAVQPEHQAGVRHSRIQLRVIDEIGQGPLSQCCRRAGQQLVQAGDRRIRVKPRRLPRPVSTADAGSWLPGSPPRSSTTPGPAPGRPPTLLQNTATSPPRGQPVRAFTCPRHS